jgi:hypothetical protein
VVPIPDDLAKTLDRIKGPTHLWESYAKDPKVYRPGRRNKDEFSPSTPYWAVLDIFEDYNTANPDRQVRSHDLRRRGITMTVAATGGNVEAAAEAIGVNPQTARRHYIDAERAFQSQELPKRMAEVLRPKKPT